MFRFAQDNDPEFTLNHRPAPAPTLVSKSVTLAHDYLLVMRGAERTFAAIAEMFMQAPIFTLLYDEPGTAGRFAGRSITTSPLQHLGVSQATFRKLLPLYPLAVERLHLPSSDVVLSSSSAFAHGVRVPDGAVHVCYCYTPFRYAWYEEDRAVAETSPALRRLLRGQLRRVRKWDLSASGRVDAYIAISQLSPGRKNSLVYEIDGASSAVAWDSEQPDHLWIGHRDRPNELLLRNPALMNAAGSAAARLPGGHVEGFADTFGAVFSAIYADVIAGAPSPSPAYATFADGHEEMLVGDAVLESSSTGRWVQVARTA